MIFAYNEFSVREAQESDRDANWNWRNSAVVRAWMGNSAEIPHEDHIRWFARRRETRTGTFILYWDERPFRLFHTLKSRFLGAPAPCRLTERQRLFPRNRKIQPRPPPHEIRAANRRVGGRRRERRPTDILRCSLGR